MNAKRKVIKLAFPPRRRYHNAPIYDKDTPERRIQLSYDARDYVINSRQLPFVSCGMVPDTNLRDAFYSFTPLYLREGTMKNKSYGTMNFVEIRIDRSIRDDAEAYVTNNMDKVFPMIVKIISDGYKMSFTSDAENECYIVALIGTANTKHNANCCISARSDTLEEAALLVLYKHYILADGEKWQTAETQARFDNWG